MSSRVTDGEDVSHQPTLLHTSVGYAEEDTPGERREGGGEGGREGGREGGGAIESGK